MANLDDITALTWRRIQAAIAGSMLAEAVLDGTVLHLPPIAQFGITGASVAAQTGAAFASKRRKAADRLALEAKQAKEERERAWREQVHTIAVLDPGPDQCPVCGLADLAELAQRDTYLHLTGTPQARVTAYGPVSAHQECAEAAPYAKYYRGKREELHHRGFHHAVPDNACTACARVSETKTLDPYPPPDGCTCSQCVGTGRISKLYAHDAWEYGDVARVTSASTDPIQRHLWTCNKGDASGYASTKEQAAQALITHARTTCVRRTSKKPPKPKYAQPVEMGIGKPRRSLFAEIKPTVKPGGLKRWVWKCQYCPARCEASSESHAGDALLSHEGTCPNRNIPGGLKALAEAGFNMEDVQTLARAKGALAPKQAPMDWLYNAVRSPDPGVRNAAMSVLKRLAEVEP